MKKIAIVLAVAVSTINLLACGDQPSKRRDDSAHYAAIKQDDGTVSFWRGKNVAERLARGEEIGGPTDKANAMKLRVTQAFLNEVQSDPDKMITVSLEKAHPGVLEIWLHTSALRQKSGEFDNFTFRPGDPNVTGYVQLAPLNDQETGGFFFLKRWEKSSIGSYAEQIWETGMALDPNAPKLDYEVYPWKTPLPENWK